MLKWVTLIVIIFISFSYRASEGIYEHDSLFTALDNLVKYKKVDKAKELISFVETKKLKAADSIKLLTNKAKIFKLEGKLRESGKLYEKVLLYYEKEKDIPAQLRTINSLAMVFKAGENIRLSKKWQLKGLKLLEKNNLPNLQESFYNNYAISLQTENKLDSALIYYQKADKTRVKYNLKNDGVTTYNIGSIYSIQQKHEKAIEYYKRSLAIRYKNQDSSNVSFPLNEIALSYLFLNKLDFAKNWLEKARKAQKSNINKLRFFEIEAEYYRKTKAFALYEIATQNYLNTYKEIINDKQVLGLQELNQRYETDKKNEQIKLQSLKLDLNKKEFQVQQAKIETKNKTLLFISFLCLSILLFALFIWQRSSRLKKETQINVLEAKIEGEEKTKLLISSNMHDFVLSDLHAIRFKLEGLQFLENIPKEELKKITEDLRLNTKELRSICHDLGSNKLSEHNTSINLKSQIENSLRVILASNTQNVNIYFDDNLNSIDINAKIKTCLIGVLKEALTNAIKHANCENIDIKILLKKQSVFLSVADNGIGYNKGSNNGIGLENMKSRANAVKGVFKIEKQPQGTLVSLNIPL